MPMNSEAPKHGGGSGGELEKRVAAVETRLAVIENTMITAEVLQRELGAFRAEMRSAFDGFRAEMRGVIGDLREEMRGEIGGLRGEVGSLREETHRELASVRGEIASLRSEVGSLREETHRELASVRGEIASLREETRATFVEVRKEMQAMDGALRVEIAKVPFETFKWLIGTAGLGAAVATAIHNIWSG